MIVGGRSWKSRTHGSTVTHALSQIIVMTYMLMSRDSAWLRETNLHLSRETTLISEFCSDLKETNRK